jgi:hypothetical protein
MNSNDIINNYLIENEFEDLKGYETFYKINKKGEIWSCWYKKIMKPTEKEEGYKFISLNKNGEKKKKGYIHRLLAIQYIENENPEEYIEIDHIDRNPCNNDLINLRWVNRKIQANNKSTNIINLTAEEQKDRIEDIKEYKRKFAEDKRRENGIKKREKIKTANEKEYNRLKTAEYRANMNEVEKEEFLEKRREQYANREQTEEQKEQAKERAKKQRQEIKEDPEKIAQIKEYKKLKAREYRLKKLEKENQK